MDQFTIGLGQSHNPNAAPTQLLILALQFVNATHSFRYAKGSGHLTGNGSFTGVMGLLQRGDIDVTSSDYSYSEERAQFGTASVPIASENTFLYLMFNRKDLVTSSDYMWEDLFNEFQWTIIVVLFCSLGLLEYYREHVKQEKLCSHSIVDRLCLGIICFLYLCRIMFSALLTDMEVITTQPPVRSIFQLSDAVKKGFTYYDLDSSYGLSYQRTVAKLDGYEDAKLGFEKSDKNLLKAIASEQKRFGIFSVYYHSCVWVTGSLHLHFVVCALCNLELQRRALGCVEPRRVRLYPYADITQPHARLALAECVRRSA